IKMFFAGFCCWGCALSISSGPLLAMLIVLAIFWYDQMLKSVALRWKVLQVIVVACLVGAFCGDVILLDNDAVHLILWVIRNLTFDPWTGYFRVETWRHAMAMIAANPMMGIGFGQNFDQTDIFLRSLDCLYLVVMWRFGIPAVCFLVLTVLCSVSGTRNSRKNDNIYLREMRTGLTVGIVAVAIIGL